MLPVGSEPVIRFAIEEALEAECDPVVVIRSPDDQELASFLKRNFHDRVRQTVQKKPKGLAHALLQGFRAIRSNQRCAAILPDNVVLDGTGIRSLIEADVDGSVVGTTRVTAEEALYFGNSGAYEAHPVEGMPKIERLEGLQEKGTGTYRQRYDQWPAPRSVARNVLTPEFFERADRRSPDPETGEIDDVPILRAMIKSSSVYGVPIDGTVYDMGTPDRYSRLQCIVHQRMKSDDSGVNYD
jgi:UTP-glucose-1-phosphate uridylyltransferase